MRGSAHSTGAALHHPCCRRPQLGCVATGNPVSHGRDCRTEARMTLALVDRRRLAMNNIVLSRPQLGFVVATRAALGFGIGQLASSRLDRDRRRVLGGMLVAVGALTTIPAVLLIPTKPTSNGAPSWSAKCRRPDAMKQCASSRRATITSCPRERRALSHGNNAATSAAGSFTPSNLATVGAIARWSISPRSRPRGMPGPAMIKLARMAGVSGQ